jgi:hypothetical protein
MKIDLVKYMPWSFIARRHYEYKQGWDLVGLSWQLLSFETFAMIFCEKFQIYGIPAMCVYFGSPLVAVLGIMLLGRKMIQVDYANKLAQIGMDVNKDWVDMKECIRDIHRKVKEDDK